MKHHELYYIKKGANHIINLAISYACKNHSIKKCMDNLTAVFSFFENSPKRQKYFECFLEFCKIDSNLTETERKEIIGLAKTRWIERNKAYDTYHHYTK